MQYLRDFGFVIKRVNIGEADKFITLFTKRHGKIELLARGVRKITSRRASHIELLNLVKFHSVKTAKNFILTEVELISSFQKMKKTLQNIGAVFLICELIDKLCPYGQKHQDIFELIYSTVHKISRENVQFLFSFQTELLARLGFWDRKRKFADEEDLRNFIENIIERKIKTRIYT